MGFSPETTSGSRFPHQKCSPAVAGPWGTLDAKRESLVGDFAPKANAFSERVYREPFVVPRVV